MLYSYAAYFAVMNVLGLLFMYADKRLAKKGKWRVPERTLFFIAALGGSLGGVLGMRLFRHKTKHRKFRIGFPLLLALHVALTAVLFYCGILKLP